MEYDKRIVENQISYHYFSDSGMDEDAPITMEDENGRQMIEKPKGWEHFTRTEKEYHVFQSALFKMHPMDVSVVDSLWQALLTRQGINVETGVVYTNRQTGHQYHSRHDDYAFYASAHALEKRTLGLLEEIGLQGFVEINPGLALRQSPVRFTLFALLTGLCLCSAVFFIVRLLRKETPPVQKPPITWDADSRTLFYYDKELLLTTDLAKLFDLLWKNQGKCIIYENLIRSLYGGENITNDNAKDNLFQAVKRLRNTLSIVPGLELKNHSGTGYQLNVHSDKDRPDSRSHNLREGKLDSD
jgi:DNA-binding winged helix-turn-helix (wHTH) protein